MLFNDLPIVFTLIAAVASANAAASKPKMSNAAQMETNRFML
jgi:hypothetical protein